MKWIICFGPKPPAYQSYAQKQHIICERIMRMELNGTKRMRGRRINRKRRQTSSPIVAHLALYGNNGRQTNQRQVRLPKNTKDTKRRKTKVGAGEHIN